MPTPSPQLVGRRFGRLIVVSRHGFRRNKSLYLCRCDCGTEVLRLGNSLLERQKRGFISGCGCEKNVAALARGRTTHGLSKNPLFRVWYGMHARCYNTKGKDYPRWGGRGIRVCEEWMSAAAFIKWANDNGYERGLTIERIDNDGPYCPQNCTWATLAQQAKNTRRNLKITVGGRTQSVIDWSTETGLSYRAIVSRLARGWSPERAVLALCDGPYNRALTINTKALSLAKCEREKQP